MKKKVIGLDLDDVLVDCNSALQSFHNARYGTRLTREDITTYSLGEMWGCSREEAGRRIDEFFDSPEHDTISPVPGAVDAVRELQQKCTVIVVTGRPKSASRQTRALLAKNYPTLVDSIHFAGSHFGREGEMTKGDLCRTFGVEMFVDDAAHFAEDVASVVERVLLFDTPWNRDHALSLPNMQRVHSWSEILELSM